MYFYTFIGISVFLHLKVHEEIRMDGTDLDCLVQSNGMD